MAMKEKIRAPRGMPDTLPDQTPLVRHLEATAGRVFGLYGYEEIRTPLFEETRLFVRGIGEATDIVEKEMYTFGDGDGAITLRPEATAPVVRAAIENNLLKKKGFWKLYYIGPMFRKERPQAGRLRQFSQIGCEAIGSLQPVVDAESILLAAHLFDEIELAGTKVKLNTIGCETCRGQYRAVLKQVLAPRRKDLCKDCQARFERNVFRILDCKNPACKQIALAAPPMREHLDEACAAHFSEVTARLSDAGQAFEIDDHLVRGFDYYTRTVFEICHSALGARDAVCGGGRYDKLVAELGGPEAGCVGFAIGVVPTLLALENAGKAAAIETPPLCTYIVAVDDSTRDECFRLAERLRRAGVSADLDCEGRSLKAQMKTANRLNAKYTAIIGPDEKAARNVTLRSMGDGSEECLPLDDAVARLAASA